MFDAESGRAVGRFGTDRPRMIQEIAFSPDGELMALAQADAATEVWDLRAIDKGLATLGLAPEGEGRVPESPAVSAQCPAYSRGAAGPLPLVSSAQLE